MIDLIAATQIALTTALAPLDWPAFTAVPEGTQPNYHVIAEIDAENAAPPGSSQYDQVTFEIHSVYRGGSRAALAAAMFQLRQLLHAQPLTAPGAQIDPAEFVRSAISRAAPDGVTYVGVSIFQMFAQPAD